MVQGVKNFTNELGRRGVVAQRDYFSVYVFIDSDDKDLDNKFAYEYIDKPENGALEYRYDTGEYLPAEPGLHREVRGGLVYVHCIDGVMSVTSCKLSDIRKGAR